MKNAFHLDRVMSWNSSEIDKSVNRSGFQPKFKRQLVIDLQKIFTSQQVEGKENWQKASDMLIFPN